MAWNPSLVSAKIEDAGVLLADGSLENLSFAPNGPRLKSRVDSARFPENDDE